MKGLDRLLAGDEMDAAGRREVEERLRHDPEARALLESVRAAERAAGPSGELPALGTLEVSAADSDEAARSLRSLLLRAVGEVPADSVPGVGWRQRFAGWLRPPVLVPAAVVALAAFLFFRAPDPALGPLQVDAVAHTRGAETLGRQEGGWQEGDAFRLRCEVKRSVVPVVFHIDPDGRLELLHPATPSGPLPRSTPESPVILPNPDSDERWELTGSGGRETFLLAAWEDAPGDLASLVAELEAIAAEAPDARTSATRVREALEEVADEVRTTVIDRR